MIAVDTFRGPYACFSNFSASKIIRPTVEHVYQANRTSDPEWQNKIMAAGSAAEAKNFGKECRLAGKERPDWHLVNIHVMFCLVLPKFMFEVEYRKILLSTKDYPLIEGNWWHDNFWGDCNCARCKDIPGQNNLGKTLMTVRKFLSEFSIQAG